MIVIFPIKVDLAERNLLRTLRPPAASVLLSRHGTRDSYQRLTQMAERFRCPPIACVCDGGSDMKPEFPCWAFVGSD